MRTKAARVVAVTMAVVLSTAAVLATSAGAKPPGGCEVAPSGFFDIDPFFGTLLNRTARTITTVDCPGASLISVDVWEHAVIGGFPSGDGVARLDGKAQIVIEFTSAGIRTFKGQVRGTADCDAAGDCNVTMEIRAQSPGGAKLELQQSGLYRQSTGEWLFLDLDGGTVRKP
jgi:hypothetical protein